MDVPPALSKLTLVDVTPRQQNALVWPVRADHADCPTVLGEGVETAAEQARNTDLHPCERPSCWGRPYHKRVASLDNVEYGDPEIARSNEILRSVVGSGVHGIAIAGTDDHDEMGVYIEPPALALGLVSRQNHYIWRTQPEGARSGPGDTDLVMYSLRKYLQLAIKGNPTVLLPLYAPKTDLIICQPLGQELRELAPDMLSQQAAQRFLGYLNSQHKRMLGQDKQSRVPNRPELIERYGWDVKYGSHALRLAYQGYEITRFGQLSLPLPDAERQEVLAVKRGEIPQAEVSIRISKLESATVALLASGQTPLPEHANLNKVSKWAIDAQRRHWGWK